MERKRVPIKDIKSNPKNPRIIKDDKFKLLVQSLKDFPEMATVREIVVNKDMIILGGNMRHKAMVEAGWKEADVKIVDWTQEQQDQFVIKDNVSGGEWDWDKLANDWDAQLLLDWGMEMPSDWGDDESVSDGAGEDDPEELKTMVVVAYKDINDLDKITDFYHLKSIDITDEMKSDLSRVRKVYVFEP